MQMAGQQTEVVFKKVRGNNPKRERKIIGVVALCSAAKSAVDDEFHEFAIWATGCIAMVH